MPLNPFSMYVRIARIERVSTLSIEADFVFIDGEELDTTLYRGETLFGTINPGTDIIPSASVVGKGDRVAVIVHAGPRYFIVSKLDRFEYNNSNRAAAYPFDVINKCLGGLCLGCEYTPGSYSYANFYIPEETIIDEETQEEIVIPERIVRLENDNPDPNTNRIADRLFYFLSTHGQNNISYVEVNDGTWPWEKLGGGPMTAAPVNINGIVKQGRLINHLPFTVDIPFGDDNYVGNLSMYSPTLTSLDKASVHPGVAALINRIQYDHYTVIHFDDDDPEWVVVIATYPAWSTAPYIKILEVPVYGWSERARNDDEDTELILDDLDRVNYLKNSMVRELETITRNWIDWNLLGSDGYYSELLYRGPVFNAKRLAPDTWTFCITDGYPYHNDPDVYQINELKRIYGGITRTLATEPTTNGSPYEYTIAHDNPADASTNMQTYWYLDYHYFTSPYTGSTYGINEDSVDQTSIIYTDGVNELTKKIHVDCNIYGEFTDNPVRSGRVKWG